MRSCDFFRPAITHYGIVGGKPVGCGYRRVGVLLLREKDDEL